MAYPIKLHVRESMQELKALQRKKKAELITKRLRVLMEIKRHGETGISKRQLSSITGVNHNSITKWRRMYAKYGIPPLLKHGRVGGFKSSILSKETHRALEKRLRDKNNRMKGYTELLAWVKKELNLEVKYITLVKYVQRNFGARIKKIRNRADKTGRKKELVILKKKPAKKAK